MTNQILTDDMIVKRAKAAVRLAIEKNKALGVPSVVFDAATNTMYEICSDGTKKVMTVSSEDCAL